MSIYKKYTEKQVEELLSNYLVSSWSYSSVNTFSRNEKEFEKNYLYRESGKSSATAVAGQAYHKALELFFVCHKNGAPCDVIDMQQAAFEEINRVPANTWKLSKTRPTVLDCISAATEANNKGINNFLAEIDTYISDVKEIIAIEERLSEWITLNGVDIPLPCHGVIDLVIRTNDNRIVVIDHKLRTSHTGEEEAKFTIGKQAIAYVKVFESFSGLAVDEVRFIENKTSKNKDGSPQLVTHAITMDDDTRRLYEALLYEPLRRMLLAVGDPDYCYIINDNDSFVDKVELYNFWMKTMIAEIEDFQNIDETKKPMLAARMRKIRDASLATISPTVVRQFKAFTEQFIPYNFTDKDMTNQEKIEHVLRTFGIVAKVQHTFEGYSSNSFLLELSAGVPVSKINTYRLDIANALDVSNVRIQKDLYVYEGRSYVAIEVGKKSDKTLLFDPKYLQGNKIPLGMDNFGNAIVWDLDNQATPHMLVCGATGSGKSVCIRSTIEYALKAGINDIYIFDPKFEFEEYMSGKIKVFNDIKDIEEQIRSLVKEMEMRVKSGITRKTLVIFDEFADAVANSRKGKELRIMESVEKCKMTILGPVVVGYESKWLGKTDKSLEENLRILLQKGRSSGFRIVAATQRASTKVITGDAKVNFPVQVCFRVPKDVDSMVVIDEPGAESLNGRGDGLIKSPEYNGVVRFQGFFK